MLVLLADARKGRRQRASRRRKSDAAVSGGHAKAPAVAFGRAEWNERAVCALPELVDKVVFRDRRRLRYRRVHRRTFLCTAGKRHVRRHRRNGVDPRFAPGSTNPVHARRASSIATCATSRCCRRSSAASATNPGRSPRSSTARLTTIGTKRRTSRSEYWNDRIAVNLRHQFFAAQAVYPQNEGRWGRVNHQLRLDKLDE